MNPNKTRGIRKNVTNSHSASLRWEESDLHWESNNSIFALSLVAIEMILQPIIVLLNVSVTIVVKRWKKLQQNFYILLSSMAIVDLLIGVMIFPILVIALERVCVLQAINTNLITCMLLSSLYHLATVAWDRYVAVRKWKDYKVIVSKRGLLFILRGI